MAQRNKPITRLDKIKKALGDDSIVTTMEGVNKLIENQGGGKKVEWDLRKYADKIEQEGTSSMYHITLTKEEYDAEKAYLEDAEMVTILGWDELFPDAMIHYEKIIVDKCSKYTNEFLAASSNVALEQIEVITYSFMTQTLITLIDTKDTGLGEDAYQYAIKIASV